MSPFKKFLTAGHVGTFLPCIIFRAQDTSAACIMALAYATLYT